MLLHEDRLFPADPSTRSIARALYAQIRSLPIVSPHGHTQASWFSLNEPFPDPAKLFVQPDHYVYRMLYSRRRSGWAILRSASWRSKDLRKVWRIFARHYHPFRGTPTRIWLDYEFPGALRPDQRLSEKTADFYYDAIAAKLKTSSFCPGRSTNASISKCSPPPIRRSTHWPITRRSAKSGWKARIIPNSPAGFRRRSRVPWITCSICSPGWASKPARIRPLGRAILPRLRKARLRFQKMGCTATDHGHPTAQTADLSPGEAEKLFNLVLSGKADAAQQDVSAHRCSPRWRA